MKNIIIILLLLFLSCKNNQQSNHNNSHLIYLQTNENIKETINDDQNSFNMAELIGHRLIGMELLQKEEEKNPYKKYSVDFTAACYSSDLCVVEINKTQVKISNYYDPKTNLKIDIVSIRSENKRLIFKLKNDSLTELSLTKFIKTIPLYEIQIKGSISENIRISNYLAKEEIISKFGGIDCGDFDG